MKLGPILTLLTAMSGITSIHAETAFNSFGPGNAVNTGSGWAVGTPSGSSPSFVQADRFVSLASGELSSISFNFGGGGSTPFNLTVSLYSDQAAGSDNHPGSLLTSAVVPAYLGFWESAAAYTTASFSGGVSLAANTAYWVVYQPTVASNYGVVAQNVLGIAGGHVYSASIPPTTWNSLPAALQTAYRVTVSPVPEPASGAMLLTGVLLAGWWVQRQRRR